MESQFLPIGNWRDPMTEWIGKNLKLIIKGQILHASEILIHIIQAPGQLKEKWELSDFFEFSKQAEIPLTNMEFTCPELNCSGYF